MQEPSDEGKKTAVLRYDNVVSFLLMAGKGVKRRWVDCAVSFLQ